MVEQRSIMDTTMVRKIDIHTHILPGIDDGAKNIEESLEIIDYLSKCGITDIVLTPHYIQDTNYKANENLKDNLLRELHEKVSNPNINLYLGNEVYICENIIDLLERHEISTLNDSRYMLIELPLTGYINNLQNILWELSSYGIIPIIAHPERYQFIQKNRNRVKELLEFNCLLQCNVDSLTGKYGKKAKKLMKWLLKNNLVHFIATDTHYIEDSSELNWSYKKLKKLVKESYYNDLICNNQIKALEDKEIDATNNLQFLIKKERS